MLVSLVQLIESSCTLFLKQHHDSLDLTPYLALYTSVFKTLLPHLQSCLPAEHKAYVEESANSLVQKGVPLDLALKISIVPFLHSSFGIIDMSHKEKLPVLYVASLYFLIGSQFGFDWLREKARDLYLEGRWSKKARRLLLEDLWSLQHNLTLSVLKEIPNSTEAEASLYLWTQDHLVSIRKAEKFLNEMKSVSTMDISLMVVSIRNLEDLILTPGPSQE
jgi:glutamate dehydrogenase